MIIYKTLDPNSSNKPSKSWLKHILITEFDHKIGPVIRHQYPYRIPGFSTTGGELRTLPELLIPLNAEKLTEEGDFHLVVLYKDPQKGSYYLTPVTESGDPYSTILEEEEDDTEKSHFERKKDSGSVLFLYTLTKTYKDPSFNRGTLIRSLTFACSSKAFKLMEGLLEQVMDLYFYDPGVKTLHRSFEKLLHQTYQNQNEFIITPETGTLVLQFLKALMIQNQLSFRSAIKSRSSTIIIYSSTYSAKILTNFILGLSEIFGGFAEASISENYMVEYYPVVDLSNYDQINSSSKGFARWKFIGTQNVLFKEFDSTYHAFYDLDTGVVTFSENLQPSRSNENILTGFLFQLSPKIDFQELNSSLMTFTISVIIKLLNNDQDPEISDESSLRDQYIQAIDSSSRNSIIPPMIFNQFFSFKALTFIDCLFQIRNLISGNPRIYLALDTILDNITISKDIKLFIEILQHFSYPTIVNDPILSFFKPLLLLQTPKDIRIRLIRLYIKLSTDPTVFQTNDFLDHVVKIKTHGPDHRLSSEGNIMR